MTAGGFSFGGGAPAPPGGGGGGFGFGAAGSFGGSTNNRDPSTATCTSSSSPPPSVRALAWDPTGPASLSLCPLPSNSQGGGNGSDKDGGGEASLDVFLSHDGTGCPPEEAECLLKCLDAREAWMEARRQQRRMGRRPGGGEGALVTNLSMDYRAALCECLMQLQSKAEGSTDDDGDDERMKDGTEEDNAGNNLELLSLTYAISHLAEIFLLPSAVPAAGLSSYPSRMDGGFHDNHSGVNRRDGPPGSLTADAVRYLRLHHSAVGALLDAPDAVAMLESDQPEYYQSPSSASSPAIPGPYDRPYWNLLLRLVIQGRLFEAWTLLSRHSACRRAEEDLAGGSGDDAESFSPEGQGFAALRAMLLAAPLPGGRGDMYCDDAGLDDYLEEELLEKGENDEEEENGEEETEDPGQLNELLVDGVPPNAYLLWEPLPRRADRLRAIRYRRDLRRCGRADAAVLEGESPASPSVPEAYQPRVALNAFNVWQETVRVAAFPSGADGRDHGVLMALFQRFPPLRQIMSLLLGTVPPAIADDASMTWSDALLVELLYARPDIMPDDIATRANVAMTKAVGGGRKGALEQVILGVMKGSAGQVIETVFGLCGGSSGAALPATMASLLCNLLVDAGCIHPQKGASDVNTPTELLLLAAESILSSFSVQDQSDVGVRTAVRLLLPHAPPKRGAEQEDIIYEPRVAAMIAEALSHRLPATDAEARDLLQLCEDTVRLGSVPIAEACESLAFACARYHGSNGDLSREVHWLLRGMEVQSCWLPEDRRRKRGFFASRRHFDALCETTANNLVCLLALAAVAPDGADKQEKEMALAVKAAEDVLEAVLQDDGMASVLRGHVESNLLEYALDIAVADAEGDTGRVAADVVLCLEERRLSEDYGGSVVSTLADPKMYVELLHIAYAVLAKEEVASQEKPMQSATCAFTVHGMHILMARLTQVLSWEGIVCADGSTKQPSDEQKRHFDAMRQAFCKGLMRAFVENKQQAAEKTSGKKEGGELSLDEEIELLLAPCI